MWRNLGLAMLMLGLGGVRLEETAPREPEPREPEPLPPSPVPGVDSDRPVSCGRCQLSRWDGSQVVCAHDDHLDALLRHATRGGPDEHALDADLDAQLDTARHIADDVDDWRRQFPTPGPCPHGVERPAGGRLEV